VSGPEVPALPVAFGPAGPGVVPELAQALLERPRAAGLERQGLELGEPLSVLLRQILRGVEPQVFRAAQRVVPAAARARCSRLRTSSTACPMWVMMWYRSKTIFPAASGP